MQIICDTNILIFWSQAPDRLSRRAVEGVEEGLRLRQLAVSDVVFWEIAMLFASKRLVKPVTPQRFMLDLVKGLGLSVLPINPQIAVLSQSSLFFHKDPADRLIAATALHHRAPLITADRKLQAIEALNTIW